MSDEKLSTKEKLELAVQTGLQFIPTIGGPLSTLYFGHKQEKRFKRIESFYEEFSREIEEIGYRFASIQSHDEDAIVAIIEKLNEKIEKEHTQEKRSYFKRYLRNALSKPLTTNDFDEKRFFLDTLSDMTLFECELLSFLYSENQPIQVKSIQKPGLKDQYTIVGSVGRLKNYGFLKATQHSFSVGGGDNALDEVVQVSDFGRNFVQFSLI